MFTTRHSFEKSGSLSTDTHQLRYGYGLSTGFLTSQYRHTGFDRNRVASTVDADSFLAAAKAAIETPDELPTIPFTALKLAFTATKNHWYAGKLGTGQRVRTTLAEVGDRPYQSAMSPDEKRFKELVQPDAHLQINRVDGLRAVSFTDIAMGRDGKPSEIKRDVTVLRGSGRIVFPDITLQMLDDEEPVIFPGELNGEFGLSHVSDKPAPLMLETLGWASSVFVPDLAGSNFLR